MLISQLTGETWFNKYETFCRDLQQGKLKPANLMKGVYYGKIRLSFQGQADRLEMLKEAERN